MKDRRQDQELRASVSDLRSKLRQLPSNESAVSMLTAQVALLANTDNGYAYRLNLKTLHLEAVASLKQLPQHIDSPDANLENSHYKVLRSNQYISSYDLDDSELLQFNWINRRKNFLIMPIIDGESLHAVIVLTDYQLDDLEHYFLKIRPFIIAFNCNFRLSNKSKRKHQLTRKSNDLIIQETKQFLDLAFNAYLIINEYFELIFANSSANEIFGFNSSTKIDVTNLLPNSVLNAHGESLPHWRGAVIKTCQGKSLLADIQVKSIELHGQNHKVIVLEDITDKLNHLEKYHENKQRLDILLGIAPVAIIQLDKNAQCEYANDMWSEYTGVSQQESLDAGWLKSVSHSDSSKLIQAIREKSTEHDSFELEFRLITPFGDVIWVKANGQFIYNNKGIYSGAIIAMSDITEHLEKENELKRIAETDTLTTIANRHKFLLILNQAIANKQRQGTLVLGFIDVDGFKEINDNLGHHIGDLFLVEFANRLRTCIRESDTVARMGGDEFTILLPNITKHRTVQRIADSIIDAMKTPFKLAEHSIYITCSIGFTMPDNQQVNSHDLLKQADLALYAAKAAGKNQYVFFDPEQNDDTRTHLLIKQSLKDPTKQYLDVVYQPQMNAKTGRIIGVEALARWNHPEISNYSTEKFITMMEESGLIGEFFDWQYRRILTDISHWLDQKWIGSTFEVSINLSARQLHDKNLISKIISQTQSFRISPSQLTFEVTETALLANPEKGLLTLEKLKKCGFRLALDDFGTGYSSLSYLRQMTVHKIKIDRSFVMDVLDDQEDNIIVSMIINLANQLGLKLIAEGVETIPIKTWLLDNGCDIHQGYLYYKPMKLKLLNQTLKNNN
jgi:diguanylate cyclase (GGDEF)-like protein/PAS domain S-box-containing protein